jgi:hypothetical protein
MTCEIQGRNSRGELRRSRVGFLSAVLLLGSLGLLAGCQAMFTYCPVEALQTSPGAMSPEQKLAYAQDALASGDPASMRAALDALAGVSTAEGQYLCAELAVELSQIPHLVIALAFDAASLYAGSMTELDTYITQYSIDPSLLMDAAVSLQAAEGLGASLQPIDYVYGTVGLLFASAEQPDGSLDFSNPAALDLSQPIAFISDGLAALASLPADDPMVLFLTAVSDYVNSL